MPIHAWRVRLGDRRHGEHRLFFPSAFCCSWIIRESIDGTPFGDIDKAFVEGDSKRKRQVVRKDLARTAM